MQHGKSHNHRPHSTGEAAPNGKSLALLLVLLVAQLMVILDITAVNIALPNLAQDLQLTGSEISWTITSYSLVFGSLLLFGGRAADLLGRRRLFLTGLGIFTGTPARGGGGAGAAVVRTLSIACLSLPPLVTSLLLVFIAARTGWFPLGGMTTPGVAATTWGPWLADVATHLPLPAIALALPVAATFERLQSQALGETVHLPFVSAARARGVSRQAAVLRHAWPVSLRAICAIYGIVIGGVLSGSFVVEYVTAWPGLGRLMYEALRARDIYLVAGCAAMGASFLAVGTLIGDLLLAAVDPRVREAIAE